MRRPLILLILATLACDGGDKADPTTDTQGEGSTGEDGSGTPGSWRYLDQDLDGYGNPDTAFVAQGASLEEGESANGLDCDDDDPEIHPGGTEICNELDDDCNGSVDEGVGSTWYADEDGDGYGSHGHSTQACAQPSGYVESDLDCDDSDPDIRPDATEICDGIDNDCDGEVDEDSGIFWYADEDYDGYGDPDNRIEACDQPDGTTTDSSDCDDGSAGSYPGAKDGCDGEDNDCDGDIDEDHKPDWILITLHDGAAYEVDRTTGALSLLADMTDDTNPSSADVREDGLAIYFENKSKTLVEFDACTGAETEIGPTGTNGSGGISFAGGGTLYGIIGDDDKLVQFDTKTGAGSDVGGLGFNVGYQGLAWDCTTDELIGIDGSSDQMFRIDAHTGAASGFISLGVDFNTVGLEYDAGRGVLYAATGKDLYEIDPITGASTKIGSFGTTEVNDLELVPPCL